MPKESFSSSPLIDYFRDLDDDEVPDDEKQALEDNHEITQLFRKDLFYRLLNEKFFIIFITAKGGEGKSTVARWIFKQCKDYLYNTKQGKGIIAKWKKKGALPPVYNGGCFAFTDTEFMDRISKAQPLEVQVKDENYETRAQVGGVAEKERKQMLFSRIRARQICFILIDPIFEDGKMSELFTYKIFANDISFESRKNRSIISVQDYNGVFWPAGHIITDEVIIEGYQKRKDDQLKEIQLMQRPEYKRKRLKKIVDAMVFWKDPETGERQDIRNIQKNCWTGVIEDRLDIMGMGGLRASTEIKQIKNAIDAHYPVMKKVKKE